MSDSGRQIGDCQHARTREHCTKCRVSPAEALAASKPLKKAKPAIWRCTIVERRKNLGLTIREIGEAVGITNAAVSVIERGADPLLTTARKLAAFFGTTVEELWPLLNHPADQQGDS